MTKDIDYWHRLWVDWALFQQRDKDFRISRPGVLILVYGNLEIWVYSNGLASFMDKKTKAVLHESIIENPKTITFYGTNVYFGDKWIFDYNTLNRESGLVTHIK